MPAALRVVGRLVAAHLARDRADPARLDRARQPRDVAARQRGVAASPEVEVAVPGLPAARSDAEELRRGTGSRARGGRAPPRRRAASRSTPGSPAACSLCAKTTAPVRGVDRDRGRPAEESCGRAQRRGEPGRQVARGCRRRRCADRGDRDRAGRRARRAGDARSLTVDGDRDGAPTPGQGRRGARHPEVDDVAPDRASRRPPPPRARSPGRRRACRAGSRSGRRRSRRPRPAGRSPSALEGGRRPRPRRRAGRRGARRRRQRRVACGSSAVAATGAAVRLAARVIRAAARWAARARASAAASRALVSPCSRRIDVRRSSLRPTRGEMRVGGRTCSSLDRVELDVRAREPARARRPAGRPSRVPRTRAAGSAPSPAPARRSPRGPRRATARRRGPRAARARR